MMRTRNVKIGLLSAILGFLMISSARGQDQTLSAGELKRMTLEELMQIEITTVSRRAEALFTTPASVQVITREDVLRSGATTLPEALRLATNLNVAQVDSRQWAISSRGFNGTTSNKLLVLIDGRSVYTPLFSGVFWDVQHVFLEDIERIEVISGPGGALWGANAVNGIIKVVTKNSNDSSSQGMHFYQGVGTEDRWLAGLRYGGPTGTHGQFRVYGMGFSKRETELSIGGGASDDWRMTQGGFRSDWNFHDGELTLQGDYYAGRVNQPATDDITLGGGNMLARYVYRISPESVTEIQTYADITHRRIPGTFGEDLGTFDVDAQHTFALDGHNIVWGAGFRHFNDRVVNSPGLAFLPVRLKFNLMTAFIQDEITIIPQKLNLTLGSKFEKNHYTGYEFQPTARVSFSVSARHFVWGAISRAVRTPSRIDRELFLTPPYSMLAGGPDFESEKLWAYEVGYRYSSLDLTLDLAAFFNAYGDLRSYEPDTPPVLRNGLEATSFGAEFTAQYNVTDWWRLHTGYAFLHKDVRLKDWSRDVNGGRGEGNDPRHRVKVHSFMDLPWNLQADALFRYIDKLPNSNAAVPGFATMDVQLGMKIFENFSLAVIGLHLLQKSHSEFGSPSTRKELQRQVLVRGRLQL